MTDTADQFTDASANTAPQPCRCHHSRAAITPTHPGHCCFVPANQTCHQAEVTAWKEASR